MDIVLQHIEGCHLTSFYCAAVIIFGYQIQSLCLEYFFYYKKSSISEVKAWKINPLKNGSLGKLYGPPFLSWFGMAMKPGRAPLHPIFATLNILVAGCFAFATCELSLRGINKMHFGNVTPFEFLMELALSIMWQNVLEYIWHLIMHVPFVYRAWHKHHHFYKSPEVWDDLYIHPIESAGYYTILYSVPFVIRVHHYTMLSYMIIMGLLGVIDHSGIKFKVKLPFGYTLYDSKDHDIHHELTSINYAFPFPWLDQICGTYLYREK